VSVCVIGIGYYTAVDLARRNARVILACRNTQTAAVAAAQMRMQTGNENVVVQELDLSLLKSVRKFASVILEQESKLDILVNNAGTAGYITFSLLSVRNELFENSNLCSSLFMLKKLLLLLLLFNYYNTSTKLYF